MAPLAASASVPTGGSFLTGATPVGDVGFPEDLSAQDRELRDAVRQFLESEVVPRIAEIDADRDAHVPGLLRQLGEVGFFLAETPEDLGGLDLGVFTAIGMIEQLGRSGSFGVAAMVQQGIAMQPILTYGTPEQVGAWIPGLASAECIGAYALTEPSSGSDALAARTTATRDAATGEWVLEGTKQFITNANWAEVFTVFAQVDGDKFTAFIVPRATPGFEVLAEEHKMGIHGSSTCPLRLTGVRVPAANLLGEVGRGHKIALNMLNLGRLKLGATMLGADKLALRAAVGYGLERRQFRTPVATFGLLRRKIADMAALIFGGEAVAYRTAGAIQQVVAHGASGRGAFAAKQLAAEEFALECAVAKIVLTEGATIVADHAVQMLGGYGYCEEFPLARNYRDVRVSRLYEGTNEINRMVIVNTMLRRAGDARPLRTTANAMRARGPIGDVHPLVAQVDEWRDIVADALEAVDGRVADSNELRGRQDLSGFLADLVAQLHVADSAALRAARVAARDDVEPAMAALAADMASLAVLRALRTARDAAEGLFNALLEPEAALDRRASLARMSALGIDAVALEARVSDALLASAGEWPEFAPPAE